MAKQLSFAKLPLKHQQGQKVEGKKNKQPTKVIFKLQVHIETQFCPCEGKQVAYVIAKMHFSNFMILNTKKNFQFEFYLF